ncbi:MAG: hypothetical protein GY927_21385 [bacterium]|nr:hypothetical protein [bacterium]
MSKTGFTLAAALAATIAFSGSTMGAKHAIPRSVTSLAADISTVEAGGYWSRGSSEGFYRVIVKAAGVEHVKHSLFLQWIKTNIEKGSYSVVKSVSIKEINTRYSQGYTIKLSRDKKAKFGTLRVKILVSRERSKGTITYALAADGRVGKYKLIETK